LPLLLMELSLGTAPALSVMVLESLLPLPLLQVTDMVIQLLISYQPLDPLLMLTEP